MGLNFAGVDILRSHRGPLVLEVNSSPGLEGIERASDKDIAGMIVQFTEKFAAAAAPARAAAANGYGPDTAPHPSAVEVPAGERRLSICRAPISTPTLPSPSRFGCCTAAGRAPPLRVRGHPW